MYIYIYNTYIIYIKLHKLYICIYCLNTTFTHGYRSNGSVLCDNCVLGNTYEKPYLAC